MVPAEFKRMVEVVRQAESAVKGVHFGPSSVMEETHRKLFRRSLYIIEDIKRGDKLTKNNLRAIRPGGGLI